MHIIVCLDDHHWNIYRDLQATKAAGEGLLIHNPPSIRVMLPADILMFNTHMYCPDTLGIMELGVLDMNLVAPGSAAKETQAEKPEILHYLLPYTRQTSSLEKSIWNDNPGKP